MENENLWEFNFLIKEDGDLQLTIFECINIFNRTIYIYITSHDFLNNFLGLVENLRKWFGTLLDDNQSNLVFGVNVAIWDIFW